VFLASIIDRIDVYLLVFPLSNLFFDWCIVLSLLICLLCVCLCPMIDDASRTNVVRELWRARGWRHSEQQLL
jgi:hypothetical protein